MYMHVQHSCARCQRRTSYPLELDLQIVLNHHMDAVTEQGSSMRVASALNCSAISSTLTIMYTGSQ